MGVIPLSENRSRYEAKLAAARRALDAAAALADELGDQGAARDLWEMAIHASKLMDESLRGKRHRSAALPGQMSISA